MNYYSFKVRSKEEVGLFENLVVLGEGINVFTATIRDMKAFLDLLISEGVEVLEVNQLDQHEPVTPQLECLSPSEQSLLTEIDLSKALGG